MKTLIYLHGFNSSSKSHKATLTQGWLEEKYSDVCCITPQLPDNPQKIPKIIEGVINKLPDKQLVGFIGSSMGGFFANFFAERCQLPAVLINPAVYPDRLLIDFLGTQTNSYTGVEYSLDRSMIEPLQAMIVSPITKPDSRLVLVQTADEVLDYREAEVFYKECDLRIEQGGDHSFQGYENWLPDIARFFKL